MLMLDLFEDMHRQSDALLIVLDRQVQCEHWEAAGVTSARFRQCMRAHFEAEEEDLFPSFEQMPGVSYASVALMRDEHDYMNSLIDMMIGAMAARDVHGYLEQSLLLRTLLNEHGRKEDFLLQRLAALREMNAQIVDISPEM